MLALRTAERHDAACTTQAAEEVLSTTLSAVRAGYSVNVAKHVSLLKDRVGFLRSIKV